MFGSGYWLLVYIGCATFSLCLSWAIDSFFLSMLFSHFRLHGRILFAIRSLSFVGLLRQFQIRMRIAHDVNRTSREYTIRSHLSEAHFDNNDEMMTESRFLSAQKRIEKISCSANSVQQLLVMRLRRARAHCSRTHQQKRARASTDRNPMRQLHA